MTRGSRPPTPARLVLLALAAACGNLSSAEPSRAADMVEEAGFRHRGDVIVGSLYLPRGVGRHPAVVLVLGSGPRDRDYGGAGPALGRHFARAGFACLACDRPGVGKSSGDHNR